MLVKSFLFSAFITIVWAAPLHQFDRRAKCKDGRDSPCICSGALGLRDPNVKANCPKTESFQFVNKKSPTDGTIHKVANNVGALQCDHIVELQFIADQIKSNAAICKHFTTAATGPADFAAFFKTINNQPNLEFVEGDVNNAKGKLFAGQTLLQTTSKAANGVESYMGLLKGARTTKAVNAIDQQMTKIMGKAGFVNFASNFNTKVNSVISSAKSQKGALLGKPDKGNPFINSNDAAKAAALKKPQSKAKLPAKKPAPAGGIQKKPAKGVAAAQKATPKKATAPVKVAKPAAGAKTKTTIGTKKPATKAAATKKPATKASATKKPATKKPATKATTSKKSATKKPVIKPAVKKPTVKKPARKPAAKKVKPVATKGKAKKV